MHDAAYWIKALEMETHPEGGFYKESYRAADITPAAGLPPRYGAARVHATAIYFLLRAGEKSHFHRLKGDEIWHFYAGGGLLLHLLHPGGQLETLLLGPDHAAGESFQLCVPGGVWFAATPAPGSAYTLVGCTMAPGFDFADFELAEKAGLTISHPSHLQLIADFSLH
jgi:uncharacterized protein